MPLKTLVKVGSITNLSDARYCAGVGVDMLGFNVVPNSDGYVSPSLYQDIRGWITGPAIVAEVYSSTPLDLTHTLEQYAPAYIETSYEGFLSMKDAVSLPFIVAAESLSAQQIKSNAGVSYWIVSAQTADSLKDFAEKLIIRISSADQVSTILAREPKPGIALTGSTEIRAGFKDYDDLSSIFDLLDE